MPHLPTPLSWPRRLVRRLQHGSAWRINLWLTLLAGVVAVAAGHLVAEAAGAASGLAAGLAAGLAVGFAAAVCNAVLLRRLFPCAPGTETGAVGAIRDELTGLYNRRHFMELVEREVARWRRYGSGGALLLVDADHFRLVNEHHGRACGDALLGEIARVVQGALRQPDLLGRFGGEALVVFLPHTDPLGAIDVADRVREEVSRIRLSWGGHEVRTTVSIGVAALEPGHTLVDALVRDADSALFAAKDAGRNCVRAAPIQPRRSGEAHPLISRR